MSSTIHAVYENGVFKPTQPVALPDKCEVEFEPRLVESPLADRITAVKQSDPALAGVYEVLARRSNSGHHDTSEQHNEHQP
jgi:predicted DNA-binding antitoxin AbrB/MazE fold protein